MPDIATLKRILEAALLASSQPLSIPQLSALFDEFEMPTHDELAQAIADLKADADGRGVELVEVASGFRYQVRRDVHGFVARLWSERQSRYSRALLETLALIAYRQPITRGEIEQIRGVAVSTQIVRTLEEREWIRVVGYRDLPGKPALLGTTRQFLDHFNLKSLDQLPALDEIREIDDFAPELAFADAAQARQAADASPLIELPPIDDANDPAPTGRGASDKDNESTPLIDVVAEIGDADHRTATSPISENPPTGGRATRIPTDTSE